MASVRRRGGVTGLVLAAGLAFGAGWPSPALGRQGSGAAGEPDTARILLNLGYATTPEGLEAAMATGDAPTVIAALNAAADLKTDTLRRRALGLLRSKNFAIQLAAGKYLGSINDPAGAQVVRNFGEAPREYVVEDHNLQLLVVDAAREVARHGHVDYAYQLPLLIEQGDWTVKTFIAQALRDFRAPQDPVVESAWLRAISIYRDGVSHEDENVRRSAALMMQTLLASAKTLSAVSAKVRDQFIELAAEGPPPGVPEAAALDFAAVAAHLKNCEEVNPREEAPKIDPDPRFVGQSAAERLLSIIDQGDFKALQTDLDNNGKFEGLSKTEWIAKLEREHVVPLDGVEKRILTRSVRTSQPTSYEVRVEIQGDQYDSTTGKWSPMVYRMTVTWWGFGWHFSAFDRKPIVQAQPGIDDIPAPALSERYPEAQAVASRFVEAMNAMDLEALAAQLADDARIRNDTLSKAEFLEEMKGLFEQLKDQVVFRPVSYEFTAGDNPDAVMVAIEARSYNRIHNRMLEVHYTLDLQRSGGVWRITRLESETKKKDQ